MTNVRIVDPSSIHWSVPNILYRGDAQSNFEYRLLKSCVAGKPAYYGFTTGGGERKTYTSPALFYPLVHIDDRIGKGRLFSENLTHFPIIMGIRVDKYLDRLREGDGEGIFIVGDIDPNDISVLFSSECDRLPQEIERLRDEFALSNYAGLMHTIKGLKLDREKSLIKRFERERTKVAADLESLCLGHRLLELPTEEMREKITKAMVYLKRKLEGE